ncbi:MAG: hypothetical protein AB1779_03330, partial [Candidatus Thermoplasmatota archaeon]
ANLQNKSITEEVAKEALGAHAHFIRPKLSDRTIEELFKDFDTTIESAKEKKEVVELVKEKVEMPKIEAEEINERIMLLEEKIKEAEKIGANVSLVERTLTLAKSNLKEGNYGNAEKYLKRAESRLEDALSKVEKEKGKLKLVTGEKGECFGCRERVDENMAVLKCSCGCIYHEKCAGGFEACPNCFVEWEKEI